MILCDEIQNRDLISDIKINVHWPYSFAGYLAAFFAVTYNTKALEVRVVDVCNVSLSSPSSSSCYYYYCNWSFFSASSCLWIFNCFSVPEITAEIMQLNLKPSSNWCLHNFLKVLMQLVEKLDRRATWHCSTLNRLSSITSPVKSHWGKTRRTDKHIKGTLECHNTYSADNWAD